MKYLFTYGTFQHPYVQEKILGRLIAGEKAVLHGYAVNCSLDYYDVIPMDGSKVEGRILEVTEEELDRADVWECVPLYTRKNLEVETASGFVQAVVYVMTKTCEVIKPIEDLSSLTNYSEEDLRNEVDKCVKEAGF